MTELSWTVDNNYDLSEVLKILRFHHNFILEPGFLDSTLDLTFAHKAFLNLGIIHH